MKKLLVLCAVPVLWLGAVTTAAFVHHDGRSEACRAWTSYAEEVATGDHPLKDGLNDTPKEALASVQAIYAIKHAACS